MSKNVLFKLLIFSAIVPATPLASQSVMLFGSALDHISSGHELIHLISLCGLSGYLGLWISFIQHTDKRILLKSTLLFVGLGAIVTVMVLDDLERWFNWILEFEEVGEIFLFMWPPIVSIIALIFFGLRFRRTRAAASETAHV